MNRKTNYFLLHDGPWLNYVDEAYAALRYLQIQHGILFWCQEGEWRAIGGTRLQALVQRLENRRVMRD